MHVPKSWRSELQFETSFRYTYVHDEVEEIGHIYEERNGKYTLSIVCLDSVRGGYRSLSSAKAALRKIYKRWLDENEDRECAEPVKL